MVGIRSLGVGSGLDLDGLVRQLVAAERQPVESRLARNESRFRTELSALGSFKGALSSLQGAVSGLLSPGALSARTATSSNQDILTAEARSGVSAGSYAVEVISLAAANRQASAAFADAGSPLGTGSLDISVGTKSFTVEIGEQASSLADIRDAINRSPQNRVVNATLLNEDGGTRLILTARDPGAANIIQVAVRGGDGGLSALSDLTEVTAAADAVVRVDGFTFTSASNSIDGVIDGLRLDLRSADPGNELTVTVSEDRSAIRGRMETFVQRLNGLVDVVGRLTAFNPESGEAGPLLGDATVRVIMARIDQALSGQVGNPTEAFNSLPALGITRDDSGRFQLDSDRFNRALNERPGVLEAVLTGDRGLLGGLSTFLSTTLGTGSLIETREQGLRSRLDDIGLQREALDRRMAGLEARFSRQFAALDTLVAQLTRTSEFLAGQLENLPGPIQRRRS